MSNAVPSSLGPTLTIPPNGTIITLTTTNPWGAIPVALLRISLGRNAGGPVPAQIVFVASTQERSSTWPQTPNGSITSGMQSFWTATCIRGRLGARVPTGIADTAAVNQAIGVLIERGNVPPAARRELARLAAAASVSIPQAARKLLDGLGSLVRV